MISFVKETGCPSVPKVINTENSRKPTVKYAEMYRNTSQSPKVMSNNFSAPIIEEWDSEDESEVDFTLNETVRSSFEQEKFDKFTKEVVGKKETPKQNHPRGNQRNWNNQKSQQLGKDFVMQNKACYNCGSFEHLKFDCKQNTRVNKGKIWSRVDNNHDNMKYPYTLNSAYPKLTSFKPAHSHVKRPFVRKTAVKNKVWVPTARTKVPTVGSKVPTAKPTVAAVKGNRGKAVKASACWIWKPKQNQLDQGSNLNGVSVIFKKYNYIDTQGRPNGSSRNMTGNISYLSEYETYDGGYVSFRHGRGKIIGKGTSSTNISGIKEVANQTMEENVSTLRFIALPNWFHKAQMVTSIDSSKKNDDSQKEQDRIISNSDASESNGNSNPTATTKDPIADQVEPVLSSIVETKVPTETSSLGNAMSFENRLEDLFRDTTALVSLNEVEADLNNMETNIQVSPTPTLRIHKVHPKSQIISPIDTPVQTRQKTKNMEEQSFIATIHQKTNPELLQYCLFSCFLSQEEPKKIFDALKDPRWVESI
ncbi:putative ribonuclease H-like domain-containing protein [Tanacetum coccineum]